MKDEQIPVHQLEHAEPTVIHQPEQDMTVLARWLQRGMEQGSRFWILVAAIIVGLTAIAVLTSGLITGKSDTKEAWIELTQAKSVDERIKIAADHPDTPVSFWAKLQSAEEEYLYGVNDLTSARIDTAKPRLKHALDLFQEIAKDAPKDSVQRLTALFGAARTLEARNELPEAIEGYREVATKFPNSPEAKQALALAKALEEPVNVQFYKELYVYKPPANPTPGGIGGTGSMFNGLLPPPGSGAIPRSPLLDLPVPAGLDAPPATTPTPIPTIPPPAETPKAEVPKTEAPKPEAPKAEPPKADAPKAEAPAPPVVPAAPTPPAEPPKTAEPPK